MLALAPGMARADNVTFPLLEDAVPGADGVSYLDLVRQVVPDIAVAGGAYEGSKVVDMRHLGGDDMKSPPPAKISLGMTSALPIRSDGKDRLLLLFDLGEGDGVVERYAVLALYNLSRSPELVDAAAVGFDRDSYFRDPPRLSLGEGKDIVLTMSTHFNSSQGYVTTAMILVRNDSLQLVDTIFTFDERFCGFDRNQVPNFRSGDRDGRTYSDIVATVTETLKPNGDPCDAEEGLAEGTRTITVTYRWDEAVSRFAPDSDAFERLAEENRTRF